MAEIPNQNHVITLPLRCGTCVFFKTLKNSKYPDTCSKIGIAKQGKPCKEYLNDTQNLNPREDKGRRVAKSLSNLDTADLNALASLAKQEITTRKNGFRLGQRVYIRIFPAEFLSNYTEVTVIQATKDTVYLAGKGKMRCLLLKPSVLTEAQWMVKKASLEKRNRIVDPKLREYTKVKKLIDIKDFEASINEIDLNRKAPKEKKVNVRKQSLTSLILRGG